MNNHFGKLIALSLFFLASTACLAQTVSPKQARRWTQQRTWDNGFKPTPHPSTNYQEFYTQYQKNKELWDKAFRWMAEHDLLTIAPGRYDIDGERCYINVQDAVTQDAEKRKIESHRQIVDLQYVVKGTERFGLVPLEKAKPITEYTPDVRFYQADKIDYVDSTPKTFFMFFPGNCHQALVKAGKEGEAVRVIVAKIAYQP